MHVIGHDLHCQDFKTVLHSNLIQQGFQTFGNRSHQDFLAIARNPLAYLPAAAAACCTCGGSLRPAQAGRPGGRQTK